MTTGEDAPAKVNLSLHVTGRRADGYHLLDSLVVFTSAGDRLDMAAGTGLRISGPEASGLSAGPDNLVTRAAALMGMQEIGLHLSKALPVASGIGGGSADAAAALRLLARTCGKPLPPMADILALGADVPVCLAGRHCRMQGIGEVLDPLPPLPPVWLVLVNPRVQISTPQVFRTLPCRDNAPMQATLPQWRDTPAFAAWLRDQRNDLESPARALAPVISQVLRVLAAQPECALARMSGSGATCFGFFATEMAASLAAQAVQASHPDWWVRATGILPHRSDQLTRATT
ncbi:4-(cytidine 5'-diphospho)-2-C-methyl-D-erythritol kinase [Roseinatronobacter alkalisoli]|uniref:4-diphosphocytidyl-2-C-methyl-D-erythritol kinase n=1 Tax=Roseinatronobacter alkalisoli TaxID=3028235 RepID=A0ABT5T9M5_9RHOB|nr:4-(cytidine 5'-diphospho)-2-C-methyl-D-erythritol kinase [Roseinatronobacter sp. HJB301]MDD7971817.1 4-(cytidine 5'-diphospho)-2-C-methyl-D-erythritol kinase [Roseinatronobacter sp. HJB301]